MNRNKCIGEGALLNRAEVARLLPQTGRALAINEVVFFGKGRLIANIYFDEMEMLKCSEELVLVDKPRKGPYVDFYFEQHVAASDPVFEGHFNGQPIFPGHETICLVGGIICADLGANFTLQRIRAQFRGIIEPEMDISVNVADLDYQSPIVSCVVEVALTDGTKVCTIPRYEAKLMKEGGNCEPHWLIEAACQAATLYSIVENGSLKNPIALCSVEAEFFNSIAIGDTANVCIHTTQNKRGMVVCSADITNQYGQLIALMKLKGAPIDSITL